jgi:hypothetical protein
VIKRWPGCHGGPEHRGANKTDRQSHIKFLVDEGRRGEVNPVLVDFRFSFELCIEVKTVNGVEIDTRVFGNEPGETESEGIDSFKFAAVFAGQKTRTT